MVHFIHYLITLDKPSGESGKIVLFHRGDMYETHWNVQEDGQEQTDIYYTGPDLELAWKAAESIRHEKSKEGFLIDSPFITFSLSAVPHSFLFYRKLECFAAKNMNQALFQELRKWRREAANSGNIPPYFIGTDKLLTLLSAFIPQTKEELMQIPGIGKHKLEQYGEAILKITAGFSPPYSFPLDWIQQKVTQEELAAWLLDEKLLKEERRLSRLKQEKEEKMRLLDAIHKHAGIQETAERFSISVSQLLKQIRELAKEGYDVLSYLDREVEQVEEKELIRDLVSMMGSDRLKPIFEKLYGSGDIPTKEKGEKYNRIRLVCTYFQLKNAS